MVEEIIIQAQQRTWLQHSVLEGYVAAYSDHLHRARYARTTGLLGAFTFAASRTSLIG